MTTNKELHVILGTGPVGITLADELLAKGKQVRLVNRSGKGQIPVGAELAAADVMKSEVVRDLCREASVVYHCANVSYDQQVASMPQMQASILTGLTDSNARLIVTDTLYMYGETHGKVMTEETPFAATTRKGKLRAQLANNYLQAHRDGRVRVALGRAADFFGPRVLNSSLGDRVFPAALSGKPIQLLGNIDLLHGYSYIVDVAKCLVVLGEHEEALGRAWHVPVVTPAVTQRAMADQIAMVLGKPVRIQKMPKVAIQSFGLVNSFMREFVEMFYQYQEPQIVDASAIEQAFGLRATPLHEAMGATIDWYRTQEQV